MPNPRDIGGFIDELKKYQVNMLPAVNTLYNALLNHPEFAKLDCLRLRIANGGGMAVQQAVAEKWLELTGCPIVEGYGLSETSPSATCNRRDATRSPAPSACRSRRPTSRSATTTAPTCRSASPARSASAGRR